MYRYLHWDVFTDRPLAGNQLTVFLAAAGLTTELMQKIAQEMAFSETTFVLPAESSDTDARVRIFTPGIELPMAGHPTIGTTFALAQSGRIPPGRGEIRLGLGIGPTSVQLEWEGQRLRFAWMSQPVAEFGPSIEDVAALESALGVEKDASRRMELPPQQASSGVPFLFVPLSSRRAVDSVVIDQSALSRLFRNAGMQELPVFVFTLDGGAPGQDIYSRMLAPAFGIAEDPGTGGASGPLGCYLVRHGTVSREHATSMVSLQGVKMGRPCHVHISIRSNGDVIERVLVGGQSVLIGEGTLNVEV